MVNAYLTGLLGGLFKRFGAFLAFLTFWFMVSGNVAGTFLFAAGLAIMGAGGYLSYVSRQTVRARR